jgi:hypothetical protein
MTNDNDDDYAAWLEHRRSVRPDAGLTDRIMSQLSDPASISIPPAPTAPPARQFSRIGPGLLLTAASLIFAVKIAALVGNLVFPTESYPEFANDIKIEEPADAHGNVSRS